MPKTFDKRRARSDQPAIFEFLVSCSFLQCTRQSPAYHCVSSPGHKNTSARCISQPSDRYTYWLHRQTWREVRRTPGFSGRPSGPSPTKVEEGAGPPPATSARWDRVGTSPRTSRRPTSQVRPRRRNWRPAGPRPDGGARPRERRSMPALGMGGTTSAPLPRHRRRRQEEESRRNRLQPAAPLHRRLVAAADGSSTCFPR